MPGYYSSASHFPSSRSLLRAAILLLVTIILTESCRKMDRVNSSPMLSGTEARFFNNNRSADAREQALVEFLKRRNDSSHFVIKTVERIGYPRWDKTITVNKNNSIENRIESDDNNTTGSYIPFVRDNENYVNAVMLVKTTSSDTLSATCVTGNTAKHFLHLRQTHLSMRFNTSYSLPTMITMYLAIPVFS